MSEGAALPRMASRPAASGDRPVWALDGRDWPLREHSRFVEAEGLRWHVQQYGHGPDLLLLHGVAAATHSWRDLGPRLAAHYRVTALDLPGHGFTSAPTEPQTFTQRGMARAVAALLRRLGVEPDAVVGHSAGAALGAALDLEAGLRPRRLVALNGALSAEHAFSATVFPGLARLASTAPVAQLFAWRASAARVAAVIAGTGSTLDPWGVELYRRLFTRRGHVSAAFAMMSGWHTAPVLDALDRLSCPLVLAAARDDRAVPFATAERLAAVLPRATLAPLAHGGHLAHEADGPAVADLILAALDTPAPKEAAR
jgi:magnesium chelatase accessory protein